MKNASEIKDLQDIQSAYEEEIGAIALKFFPKFSAADFEAWCKKPEAQSEPVAGIASRIARNMPAWEGGGSRLPAFREIMSQDLAELRAALATAESGRGL